MALVRQDSQSELLFLWFSLRQPPNSVNKQTKKTDHAQFIIIFIYSINLFKAPSANRHCIIPEREDRMFVSP